MTNREAIEKILEGEAAEKVQKALDVAGLSGIVAAVPTSVTLKSLEPFHDKRFSFRGTMNTNTLADFAKYCNARLDEGSEIFVEQKNMCATCIINLGATERPGHANHRAVVALEKTAEYQALLRIADNPLSQRELAEWFEDWRDYIQVFGSDGESLSIIQAIAAVRKITIETARNVGSEVQDFSASRSAMESIEAKAEIAMPAAMDFKCEPYRGLDERPFTARVSILTGSDSPTFRLRLVRHDAEVEHMANEFAERIRAEITAASVYIGNFDT